MGLIQYYHIICKPVNQAICIFVAVPIVYHVILFQQNVLLLLCSTHNSINSYPVGCLPLMGGREDHNQQTLTSLQKIATAIIKRNNGLTAYNRHKHRKQHRQTTLINGTVQSALSMYFLNFSLPFYLIDSRSPTVFFYPH